MSRSAQDLLGGIGVADLRKDRLSLLTVSPFTDNAMFIPKATGRFQRTRQYERAEI